MNGNRFWNKLDQQNTFNILSVFPSESLFVNSFMDLNGRLTVPGIPIQAAHKVKMTMHVKQALLREFKKLKTKPDAFILYPMSSSHSERLITKTAQKLFQIKSEKSFK